MTSAIQVKKSMITMSNKKLKKLQREYARVIQHPDMTERAIELKCEIDAVKREAKYDER